MSSSTASPPPSWRGEPLTIGQLGRVLLRHWILLVLGLLIGALGGFVAAKLTPPVYTATSTMLVKAVPGTSAAANYEAAQYAVARAKAYPVFIYNLSVLTGIQSDLETKESLADLQDDLTASTIADTPLVQVTAKGATPAEARDKANAALRRLSSFIVQIETVGGRSPISVEPAVIAAARPTPTSPRPLLYVALGAVVGFALAVAASLIHAYARAVREPRAKRQTTVDGDHGRVASGPRHSNTEPTGRSPSMAAVETDVRVPGKPSGSVEDADVVDGKARAKP